MKSVQYEDGNTKIVNRHKVLLGSGYQTYSTVFKYMFQSG